MRLYHFFRGTLRKEDVASAFLATALEGSEAFRHHFFGLMTVDDGERLGGIKPQVAVELPLGERRADVILRADDTVVLIENKVNSGALQEDQLGDYYRRLRAQEAAAKRMLVVLVAPQGIGTHDYELANAEIERMGPGRDSAHIVTWEDLARFHPAPGNALDQTIETGMATVLEVVQAAKRDKYPRVLGRQRVAKVANLALVQLAKESSMPRLKRFGSRNVEEILTAGGAVTVWIDAEFAVDPTDEALPLEIPDTGPFKVTLRTLCTLAGHVKGSAGIRQQWEDRVVRRGLIAGGHHHISQPRGWLLWRQETEGLEQDLAARMAEAGLALIRELRSRLGPEAFGPAGNGS
jgi:hypothetical protein